MAHRFHDEAGNKTEKENTAVLDFSLKSELPVRIGGVGLAKPDADKIIY